MGTHVCVFAFRLAPAAAGPRLPHLSAPSLLLDSAALCAGLSGLNITSSLLAPMAAAKCVHCSLTFIL